MRSKLGVAIALDGMWNKVAISSVLITIMPTVIVVISAIAKTTIKNTDPLFFVCFLITVHL